MHTPLISSPYLYLLWPIFWIPTTLYHSNSKTNKEYCPQLNPNYALITLITQSRFSSNLSIQILYSMKKDIFNLTCEIYLFTSKICPPQNTHFKPFKTKPVTFLNQEIKKSIFITFELIFLDPKNITGT